MAREINVKEYIDKIDSLNNLTFAYRKTLSNFNIDTLGNNDGSNGNYWCDTTCTGVPKVGYYRLLHFGELQIAIQYLDASSTDVWIRLRANGAWGTWGRLGGNNTVTCAITYANTENYLMGNKISMFRNNNSIGVRVNFACTSGSIANNTVIGTYDTANSSSRFLIPCTCYSPTTGWNNSGWLFFTNGSIQYYGDTTKNVTHIIANTTVLI